MTEEKTNGHCNHARHHTTTSGERRHAGGENGELVRAFLEAQEPTR
jgi:hypothetical protein